MPRPLDDPHVSVTGAARAPVTRVEEENTRTRSRQAANPCWGVWLQRKAEERWLKGVCVIAAEHVLLVEYHSPSPHPTSVFQPLQVSGPLSSDIRNSGVSADFKNRLMVTKGETWRGRGRGEKSGAWDEQTHTVPKLPNQQGPTV